MERSSVDRHREPMQAIDRLLNTPSSPSVRHLQDLQPPGDEQQSGTLSETGLESSTSEISSAVTSGSFHPQHELAGLIDGSDKEVIKTVLLHLCTISPALSGALTRGLTLHAKPTQTDYPKDNGGVVNRTTSHGPLASVKRPRSSSPGHSDRTPQSTIHNIRNQATSSTERKTVPDHVTREKNWNRTPGPGPSIRISRNWSDSKEKMEQCINCGQMFVKGSDTADCFYHPGSKRKVRTITGLLQVQYTCCHGSLDDPPCENGQHVAEAKSEFDSLKRTSLNRELEFQQRRKTMRLD